ncbi:MAG TPA: S-layer homology domain-containing protein [Thermoanaerobaculia bacterium]
MHERRRISVILLLSLLAVPSAYATTIAPPANLGQLARISEAVVFAQAVESRVEEGSPLPYTVTRFMTLQRVAGADTGLVFEVREPGGAGQRRAAAVAGAPRYRAGGNYLLFLDRAPEQRWRSRAMAYGLLVEEPGSDVLAPLPEAADVDVFTRKSFEPTGRYHRDALLRHLGDVARGAAAWDSRKVAAGDALESKSAAASVSEKALVAPAVCRFLGTDLGDGLPIRWFGFETGATTVTISPATPGQTGISDGGVAAVQEGAASWTNHTDSVIRLAAGSARPASITCTLDFDRDPNGVVFNDPCGDIPNFATCNEAGATFSFGGVFYDPGTTLAHDGQMWHPATSTWVVINNGTECVGELNFKEVVAHELGHTQGFGHHVPANPADALMSEPYKGDGLGAALRVVDKGCASFAYHTFLDVPYNFFAWRFVEAVENAGVMTACNTGNFCPGTSVTRGSMAQFLLRAKEGGGYVPPPCTTATFSDVPCSDPLAPWVEELVRRNVTAGCGNGQYCPNSPVTRNQMAVFLIKTFEGPAYVPPACVTPPFNDVPCVNGDGSTNFFAPWVKLITDRGITAGCGNGNYCPNLEVNRGQMSVFVTQTFALPLPPAPLP